jgi:hypothetical protein
MMDNKLIVIVLACVIFVVGVILGVACTKVDNTQKKYKMNLKCVQGELYEEVRPNMFVKSHLECFEQRSF